MEDEISDDEYEPPTGRRFLPSNRVGKRVSRPNSLRKSDPYLPATPESRGKSSFIRQIRGVAPSRPCPTIVVDSTSIFVAHPELPQSVMVFLTARHDTGNSRKEKVRLDNWDCDYETLLQWLEVEMGKFGFDEEWTKLYHKTLSAEVVQDTPRTVNLWAVMRDNDWNFIKDRYKRALLHEIAENDHPRAMLQFQWHFFTAGQEQLPVERPRPTTSKRRPARKSRPRITTPATASPQTDASVVSPPSKIRNTNHFDNNTHLDNDQQFDRNIDPRLENNYDEDNDEVKLIQLFDHVCRKSPQLRNGLNRALPKLQAMDIGLIALHYALLRPDDNADKQALLAESGLSLGAKIVLTEEIQTFYAMRE